MLDLLVNGNDHGGWLGMSVQRSMQEMCGSFNLQLTDPRVTGDPRIRGGDLCTVSIRNKETDPKFQVIEGFVEMMSGSGNSSSVTFEASGRDRTGDLVDSAITRIGEWRGFTFLELVEDLAADFKIKVAIDGDAANDPEIVSKEIPLINYDQGDTYQQLIAKYAKLKQVLVYTLPSGELFITRVSKALSGLALIEGENILEHGINLDWTNIYREYIVKGSRQSQDNEPEEEVTQVEGLAIDSRFPRVERKTIILPDEEQTSVSAQGLADWTASTRLAQAEAYTVVRQGWFPIFNQLAYVKIDSYELDANMLIEGYELVADDSGKKTIFNVVHPKAFALLPDSTIKTDKKDSDLIKTVS